MKDMLDPPFVEDGPVDGADWAHASGWAQLSGRRRRLTCVVSCCDQAMLMAHLLPRLSDMLTECGYPWELIVVDRGSADATPDLARAWTELPGFRCLRVDSTGRDGRDIEAGLLAARGDAVVVVDPEIGVIALEAVRRLVLAWEDDAVLAHAADDPRDSTTHAWTAEQVQRGLAQGNWTLPPACLRLGLLDRRVVDWLVAA